MRTSLWVIQQISSQFKQPLLQMVQVCFHSGIGWVDMVAVGSEEHGLSESGHMALGMQHPW